jgi:alkylation response protein AidB-like acyl-CoA dehydrogenase
VLDAAQSSGEGGIDANVRNAPPHYFWRSAMSIYGGSNETQRNIVAQHVLGLSRRQVVCIPDCHQ